MFSTLCSHQPCGVRPTKLYVLTSSPLLVGSLVLSFSRNTVNTAKQSMTSTRDWIKHVYFATAIPPKLRDLAQILKTQTARKFRSSSLIDLSRSYCNLRNAKYLNRRLDDFILYYVHIVLLFTFFYETRRINWWSNDVQYSLTHGAISFNSFNRKTRISCAREFVSIVFTAYSFP